MLFTLKSFTRLNSFIVSLSSFICTVHPLRLPLVCALHWIGWRYVYWFQRFNFFLSSFTLAFVFNAPFVSFHCWSKALFHWLLCHYFRCHCRCSSLAPLPLFTTNLVHAQGWFLNFLIVFFFLHFFYFVLCIIIYCVF